jgi:hypothetical protein
MPIDFAALFNDDKNYPDDMALTMANGDKVLLRDIRSQTRNQQQQIAQYLGELQRQREVIAQRQKEANDYADKANAVYRELEQQVAQGREQQLQAQRQQQAAANGGVDPEQLYESDIWYAPMRKRNSAFEQTLAKQSNDIGNLVKALTGLVTLVNDDRLANQYEATADLRKRSKNVADWDFDKFKKYVEDEKIVDKQNFPSIRSAVERLTADERLEMAKSEEYERGLREGEVRARMGAMPRPGSANAAVPGSLPQPSTIDEALAPDSIANDSEIMDMLANLSKAGADLTTGGTFKQ